MKLWNSLTGRRPVPALSRYVRERGLTTGSSLQFYEYPPNRKTYNSRMPSGICGPGMGRTNGQYRGNFLVPNVKENPYPIQGHFGITIANMYRQVGSGTYNLIYVYLRCGQPSVKNEPFIRLVLNQKDSKTQNFYLQYVLKRGGTYVKLAGVTIGSTTGRVRIETELIGNTLWIAASAPKVKFELPPTSIDVTGTDFLKRTDVAIVTRARGGQTRVRLYFPLVVDNHRELLKLPLIKPSTTIKQKL
jgi:hypothetical protein